MSGGDRAVVLVAHGTVDALEELPAFVANIRRGRPAPLELIAELRRRYEAIGGTSPMNRICGELAASLERALGLRTRFAARLWRPHLRDVFRNLAHEGVGKIVAIPLAQYSAHVYAEAVEQAARELRESEGISIEVAAASNWGQEPALIDAYTSGIRGALQQLTGTERERTSVFMTAHSLPLAVIDAGDPYEREVRTSAEMIASALGPLLANWVVAFQSQGMGPGFEGRPIQWLGPDLKTVLDDAASKSMHRVLFAPVGFLCDHVEILYDLDIEACAWAVERRLTYSRASSLNTSPMLIEALVRVAHPLLERMLGNSQ